MILHTCKDKNNLHRHFNHYTDKSTLYQSKHSSIHLQYKLHSFYSKD